MVIWSVIGVMCGLALGTGLALSIVVKSVKESNDMGDSKGNMRDFGAHINMLYAEDDMHKIPTYRRD